MTTTAWARQRRRLSEKATARPGVYNPDLTPWVAGIHDALDDPAIHEVVCMKSAQVAWTDGVLLNYLGRRIDIDPAPMILMFAKEEAAKEFNDEKLVPMIEVTPALLQRIPINSRRDRDNRWDYKGFPGGFLKLVGSNSPSSVKSTPAPIVAVEEPDDCNTNVREQGDTITLLKERTKSFPRRKVIFGGTPTIEGASNIEAAYKGSDQRKFWIPCPHCDERQVLSWEHVKWVQDPETAHEVYAHALPESARYCCPHCQVLWTDAEKNRAVRLGEWRADAPFRGVAGFYINELYSPFPGSRLPRLVEKHLTAQYHLEKGDDTKARSFRNNTEGLPYAYKSDLPEAGDLSTRAEAYDELTCPAGGLVLTAGVDVQHDRLAIVIRAWGRGEESWLVYWGEIFGSTLNHQGGAWLDLDKLLFRDFKHASSATMLLGAASIDGSDGNRTEVVHEYVRSRRASGRATRLMTVKGAAEQGNDRKEIFSVPKLVDPGRRNKPAKRGLETYIVGTHRAKDLILETRVKLAGSGPARMHYYAGVRADYWEQLVSEIKAPSRMNRSRKVWTKKASVRNEGLDCEVYALHAARSLKTNLLHEAHWVALEQRLRQRTLLGVEEPTDAGVKPAALAGEGDEEDLDTMPTAPPAAADKAPAHPPAPPAPQPVVRTSGKGAARPVKRRRSGGGGYKAGSW